MIDNERESLSRYVTLNALVIFRVKGDILLDLLDQSDALVRKLVAVWVGTNIDHRCYQQIDASPAIE